MVFFGQARAGQLFSDAIHYETPPGPFGLAAGDVNLDGIQDLVAAVYDSASVTIHLGKPDGTFEPRRTEYGPGNTQDIVIGKLDGDAYPDLAVTPGGSVVIYHGNGDGTFPVIDEIYIDNVTHYPQ